MNVDHDQFSISELAKRKGSWKEIAEECEVSYDWLCKFSRNEIPEPGYHRVMRLARHLQSLSRKDRKRNDKAS